MSFKKINVQIPVIKVKDQFNISKEYRESLDLVWEKEKKKNHTIFDGQVLYFEKIIKNEIICSYSNYRYWYSQNKLNNRNNLNALFPVAVTGIVKNGNQILLGKRGQNVSQDKGLYDVLPSGGISSENNGDYKFQLIQEFNEELEGKSNDINSIDFLYLLKDDKDKLIDIVSMINVSRPLDNFKCNKNEYDRLLNLNLERESFDQIKQKLNPISKFIIGDLLQLEEL